MSEVPEKHESERYKNWLKERVVEKKLEMESVDSTDNQADLLRFIAKMMIDESGLSIESIFHEPLPGDVKLSQADISLAKKELGWFPESTLDTWFKGISIIS